MTTPSNYRGWSGRAYGWRYLAQRIDGTGPAGAFLDNELPLQDVSITDVLSGPPQLTAVISPVAVADLLDGQDDPTIFKERGVLIHAECDNEIRGSFLLMGTGMSGPNLSLDASGMTTVAKDMGYPGVVTFSQVDPLDIPRHFWDTIQADPDSNIALQVDQTTRTPLLVGGLPPAPQVTGTASSSSGDQGVGAEQDKPLEYNWWSTHDMGGEIDKLAEATPFSYHERHVWNYEKTQVLHYLEFGYPTIGRRRSDLRFVLGENIQVMPDLSRDGADFANHVVVLGAGEGSEMIRAEARRRDGRVRTMVTVDDKSITDQTVAQRVAALELARRQQLTQLSEVVVRNSDMAPYGSFGVGDEIPVAGMTDWSPFDVWARVTQLTVRPDVPDLMIVSLMRSDWVI